MRASSPAGDILRVDPAWSALPGGRGPPRSSGRCEGRVRDLIIARLLQGLLVIVGVVVVVFLVVRIIPGDPVRLMGPLATDANLAVLRSQWGLDLPIQRQFLLFVLAAAHGDLGTSIFMKQPVVTLIAERFPATAALA